MVLKIGFIFFKQNPYFFLLILLSNIPGRVHRMTCVFCGLEAVLHPSVPSGARRRPTGVTAGVTLRLSFVINTHTHTQQMAAGGSESACVCVRTHSA